MAVGAILTRREMAPHRAALGLVMVALLLWAMPGRQLADALLFVAALLLLPLALCLLEPDDEAAGWERALYRVLLASQMPLGLVAVVGSALTGQGELGTGLLAGLWALFGALVTLVALGALWRRRDLASLGRAIGFAYFTGGGIWLVITRLGLNPGGFSDMIVKLTAVHFHYAGCFSTLLGTQLVVFLEQRRGGPHWAARIIAAGIISGMVLVAIGISGSALIELLAVLGMTGSVLAWSVATVWLVVPQLVGWRKGAMALSALGVWVTMAAAITYGVAEFRGETWLTIEQMIHLHGWVNALVFVLPALAVWVVPAQGQLE